jgi:glycosyltransferase involved in cell wall biosynthesis
MNGADVPIAEPSRAAEAHAGLRVEGQDPSQLYVGAARVCIIVPAFDASRWIHAVLGGLLTTFRCDPSVILVVDDGSTDDTAEIAAEAGVRVVRCPRNGGKGAALVRGMQEARALGFEVALTVDADGQHPAREAAELLVASTDPRDLVLGIRDLVRDGAPSKNQLSNGISNFFLSLFAGRPLRDTQCGLRRYPIRETLALGARAKGYAFEAEVLLRAVAAGVRIIEHPVRVVYPPEEERVTHFDSVKDPMRIVAAVVRTLVDLRRSR